MDEERLPTLPRDAVGKEPPGLAEYREGFHLIGQKLLDRYEIFGVKQGGFGIVYFVSDSRTGQDYALKTYKSEFMDSLRGIEGFKAEVDLWIRMDPHPNIVKAYFVEVISDQPYLFLEYVDGGAQTSLRERLHSGRLGESQAIALAYQLCLGMEFAGQQGEVAHLDLKPENILIDRKGTPKITDFGLAHRVRMLRGRYPRVGAGTWPYAAPERFTGDVADSRSDIYSLGVIFYEMLTGDLPYPFELSKDPDKQYRQLAEYHAERQSREWLGRIYYEGIPGVGFKREIGLILNACLDHFQSERWQDFSVLREVFEREFNSRPPEYAIDTQVPEGDLYSRALTLHRIGRYSEALSAYNRLLQQHPDEGRFWLGAARTLLAIDQTASARQFLQRALRLDPTLEEAQHLLSEFGKEGEPR
jgi:serine/threonine protein kinase